MPYLLNMDRAQVLAWDADKFFHLAGVFASFPSDIDSELKRFGIRVKGAGSDTVEKFFSTFESAVLFPEFLARAVRQGYGPRPTSCPPITATVTRIDAMDYRSIYSVPEEADRSLAYVAEGASIPASGHPHARAPRPPVQARQNARGVL